ncbi:MAG: putative inorganic carbon transporter subunit DabA, partial [Halobaculum sp.]
RDARERYDRLSAAWEAGETVLKRLQSNAATAFSFVESAGSGYGLALAGRTLLPGRVYDLLQTTAERTPSEHEFCEPTLDRPGSTAEASTAPSREDGEGTLPQGLTLDEKVSYAASAFELMGIEEFGRLVVFVGHASQTANNPFDSSLDCGACAGNPGGPSARVLAAICNDPAVRDRLAERGIDVPADTYFLAGEHETTTDRVRLFDERVPESHATDVRQLRSDLDAAREGAATERAASMDTADVSEVADGAASGTGSATLDTRDASADETGTTSGQGVRETERRAADWAETRPEWGLAGNAAFVIGPRSLTADLDLGGRSFLHSYDWRTDPDGDALAAIVAGPLVVTQWINSQYYFASVDNAVYGSGSKITHNPVGNVAVYQGNGGDVQTGLPLQSLYASDDDPYHQPLRLSAVIHAPVDRVTDVLADHDHVVELLDNDWLSLTVVDPRQDHTPFHYDGDLTWMETTTGAQSEPETPAARPDSTVDVTADD